MKSAVAVLTFRRQLTLQTMLQGLERHCPGYPTAIFEDCGQRDGTEKFLAQGRIAEAEPKLLADEYFVNPENHGAAAFPGMQVFLGSRNLGVTGNTNRALHWFLTETDADHLCLCNDDLHVDGDFVRLYGKAHQDLDVGFFCFSDFEGPKYAFTTAQVRGYTVKFLSRYTGIMMSMTRDLVNKIGYFDTEFGNFGEEHSIPAEGRIWMADGSHKAIGKVHRGDEVVGWVQRPQRPYLCKSQVLGVKSYESELVQVTFESGRSLVCTPDHRWLNFDGGQFTHPMVGRRLVHVLVPSAEPQLIADFREDFRQPDKILSVVPFGYAHVYCLRTSTGNYVAEGYASKNCDFTIRARFAGGIRLSGVDMHCLDIGHKLLRHQECATSLSGAERQQADAEASQVMQEASHNYAWRHYHRPFRLHRMPPLAGAHSGGGISVSNLLACGYPLVDDVADSI